MRERASGIPKALLNCCGYVLIGSSLLTSHYPGTATRRAGHFLTTTITLLILISISPATTITIWAGSYCAGTIALITKFHLDYPLLSEFEAKKISQPVTCTTMSHKTKPTLKLDKQNFKRDSKNSMKDSPLPLSS